VRVRQRPNRVQRLSCGFGVWLSLPVCGLLFPEMR